MYEKKDNSDVMAVVFVLSVILFIVVLMDAGTEKSSQEIYSGKSSYKSNRVYRNTSSNKTESYSTTVKNSYESKTNNYNSNTAYDEGYEAVYDDDDYDWDRYQYDDDYASGVDDAMDELDW